MFWIYIWKCVCLSSRTSWLAVNGLLGSALGGAVMTWQGAIQFINENSGPLAKGANIFISTIVYAIPAFFALFALHVCLVSPFFVWGIERKERLLAEAKFRDATAIRLPRPLAYEGVALQTEANGQDAVIDGFTVAVRNNGPETLLWRMKHLILFLDGTQLEKIGESATWPAPGARQSGFWHKFDIPLAVARGTKQVTAEIEISYDNDPPLGIRTVWQRIEYPIGWFDTQAPLFNTINVVAHREGPC
jgi:hypothetical protein